MRPTLALLVLLAGPLYAQEADLGFATGVAAGRAAADSVDGYAADALIGLGIGVVGGLLDASDQDERGYTRRQLYARGLVIGGLAGGVGLAFSEWRTEPSTELLLIQPDDANYRDGFVEGFSSRKAYRNRVGALFSMGTFLVAHALTITAAATDDGTTYPLFSVQVSTP